MTYRLALALAATLPALFVAPSARAEGPAQPGNRQGTITDAKGRKITVVDFDDASIEGKAKAPDGFVLQSRSPGSFKNIMELRRNFRPQIQGSAYEGLVGNPVGP